VRPPVFARHLPVALGCGGSKMRTARYNEQADRRSWASMRSLFDEVFR
jgi:hypothetical protein